MGVQANRTGWHDERTLLHNSKRGFLCYFIKFDFYMLRRSLDEVRLSWNFGKY